MNSSHYNYNTEKAKTDSITKLYSMETELKKMIVSNSKLQNEIQKEIDAKEEALLDLMEQWGEADKALQDIKKDCGVL
mgnify:CR=1 FL=1